MSSGNIKVLFAHDGPLFKTSDGSYYGIHITEKLKQRYLYMGDELTFLMRVKNIESSDIGKYSQISTNNLTVKGVSNFKTFPGYFAEKRKVEKLAEQCVLDNDIIVARLPSMLGSMVIKYARKHNKPILCEMVACSWDALWNHSLKGKIVAPYFYVKQKMRMKEMPYVVYVTEKFLQNRYPTTGKTTNSSNVELKQSDELVIARRLEKINNRDNTKPLQLGTIAAIDVLYKGQADVIKALADLKKQNITFIYKLVGQGNPNYLTSVIKQYGLENEVQILGPLKHEEIFSFIDGIDIYMQPSKVEGLPRAVIEAMSRACPVIGADAGGTPELINPDYIYKKGNVQNIISLLKNIDKQTMIQLAQENFKKSKEYTADVLLERRFNFYDTFMKDYGIKKAENTSND